MALRTPNTAQILIKSPVTSNGRDPIMGTDGRILYKETIAMAGARANFEKINAKLPTHLKMIIEDYKEPGTERSIQTEPKEAPKVKNVTDDKK